MKKLLLTSVIVSLLSSGCYVNHHYVGTSHIKTEVKEKKREVYLIGGLAKISDVDSGQMAKGLGAEESYLITTKFNVVDYVISFLTLGVVTTRTVIVTKTQPVD